MREREGVGAFLLLFLGSGKKNSRSRSRRIGHFNCPLITGVCRQRRKYRESVNTRDLFASHRGRTTSLHCNESGTLPTTTKVRAHARTHPYTHAQTEGWVRGEAGGADLHKLGVVLNSFPTFWSASYQGTSTNVWSGAKLTKTLVYVNECLASFKRPSCELSLHLDVVCIGSPCLPVIAWRKDVIVCASPDSLFQTLDFETLLYSDRARLWLMKSTHTRQARQSTCTCYRLFSIRLHMQWSQLVST